MFIKQRFYSECVKFSDLILSNFFNRAARSHQFQSFLLHLFTKFLFIATWKRELKQAYQKFKTICCEKICPHWHSSNAWSAKSKICVINGLTFALIRLIDLIWAIWLSNIPSHVWWIDEIVIWPADHEYIRLNKVISTNTPFVQKK